MLKASEEGSGKVIEKGQLNGIFIGTKLEPLSI